jgi:murein DD-endopeptidase MepM/ murein hydrolase activator NlpD
LAEDRRHHKSKKNRYTIILVPNEDASKAKNLRFAAWQLIFLVILFACLSATLAILVFTYTPVGQVFPLKNPGLENKYGKELVSLSRRMTSLMEELVEIRSYNLKLRRALGENVQLSDSGRIIAQPKTPESVKGASDKNDRPSAPVQRALSSEQMFYPARNTKVEQEMRIPTTFPAIIPTEGYITRGFDPGQNHYGLDFAGKTGTLVVAAADGNVVFSGWTYEDGYVIIISHAGGFITYYKHNQTLLKSANSFVRRGEPIATLGNSGTTSSGPHLHFEIWKDGTPVDPSIYLINLYL